jgi:hypothetical protein
MTDITPEHDPVEPPPSTRPGDGRYVREPEGEDPRDSDRLHQAEVAARLTFERQVTHAEPVEDDMGISSEDAGCNPADRDQLDG